MGLGRRLTLGEPGQVVAAKLTRAHGKGDLAQKRAHAGFE